MLSLPYSSACSTAAATPASGSPTSSMLNLGLVEKLDETSQASVPESRVLIIMT
ncbi:hypothetical protein RUND412_011642, partial [Rhizina undulata]